MEMLDTVEDRFSQIDIERKTPMHTPQRTPQNPKTTVGRPPNLSTSKRAEARRSISRSTASLNSLYVAKTPSRVPSTRYPLVQRTQKSQTLKPRNRLGPDKEFSYMKETSSSLRKAKVSNPFTSVTPDNRYPQVRRVSSREYKPSDITNVSYLRPTKPPVASKIDVKTREPSGDVYTRLYNESKVKVPARAKYVPETVITPTLSRKSSSLNFNKEVIKITSLHQLYLIIYGEDPMLFEEIEPQDFTCNEPQSSEDICSQSSEPESTLDVYERGEILRHKDIYFVPAINGSGNDRTINIRSHADNYGFDDNEGNYVVLPGDHIKYRYQIISVLGNGSFGNVVRCWDKKYVDPQTGTNKAVAIKIIKSDINWSLQAVYEIKMLKHLNGEPIPSNNSYTQEYGMRAPVLTYFDHFHFRGHMCIVTELLSLNLYSMLELVKFQGLSLDLLKIFIRKILTGIEYIHSAGVLHCDIKPENIMIKLPPGSQLDDITEDSLVVKIIDFGTSCFTNEISYSYIQSRFYRAPEVILGAKYDKMIDIWSLGCIVAELFTGDPLLPGKNELEQIGLILELFGGPTSLLILNQRNTLLKSIREQRAVNKFDEKTVVNPNLLTSGIADEKSIKKTLLYTLFDMEGRINMQFLNMRVQAAQNMGVSQSRKVYKIASRSLDIRLRLRCCNEDSKTSSMFMNFLHSIFKWDPSHRASASELLADPFLV